MKPIVEALACTTAQASVNGTWHSLSTYGTEFNVSYQVTVDSPAVATAASFTVHGTLVDVVADGVPTSALAVFPLATHGADPAVGTIIASARSAPITAIMVSITGVSSNTTGTFRLVQQGV